MEKKYDNFEEVIKEIKKEGTIENIDIEKVEEGNYLVNRKFKASTIKKGLVASAACIALAGAFGVVPNKVNESAYVVEAASKKKDKTKPKFTMKGSSKIETEPNKSIKIPKVTAKDNKDGNVTKKIDVTVKKGSKKYASIAKKIKNNKSVKFPEEGTYKITYTVKDKAGNKATKTRTVMVTKASTYNLDSTTEEVTTETTTEKVTTEVTTEKVTTTEEKTEKPTEPEKPTSVIDPSVSYANYNINRVTVNGNDYNISTDENFYVKINDAEEESNNITINIENDYENLYTVQNSSIAYNSQYLKYLGKITAIDSEGNDISNNVVIFESYRVGDSGVYTGNSIFFYVEDSKGNSVKRAFTIYCLEQEVLDKIKYEKIDNNPIVYGNQRKKETDLSIKTNKEKKYKL